MRPAAIIGALVGAALGALIWAGVATWTGLEIGWVAWGIGGLVGFGAALLGGVGMTTGVVCALLALVSIFAGKWIAVDAIAEREIRKVASAFATLDVYQETQRDAEDFAMLGSEAEYPEFMIVHGYTNAGFEDEVDDLELLLFREQTVPTLREFQSLGLAYPQWRQHVSDEAVRLFEAEISNVDVVKENLSAIDVVFALLGLITAFQVGARGLGSAAFGADKGQVSGDRWRAPGMHGSRYGDTAEGYGTRAVPASDAPILRDEPANPYAHPPTTASPGQRQPAAPFQPRTIGRLDQTPQQAQPEEAGARNPYA